VPLRRRISRSRTRHVCPSGCWRRSLSCERRAKVVWWLAVTTEQRAARFSGYFFARGAAAAAALPPRGSAGHIEPCTPPGLRCRGAPASPLGQAP
jgi:hypothetical protein